MTKDIPEELQTILHQIEEDGKHCAGRAEAIRFLKGQRLTLGQAVKANCYMCNNLDGQADCQTPTCPFYQFMAYNPNKQALSAKRGYVRQKKQETVDEFLQRMERSSLPKRGVK